MKKLICYCTGGLGNRMRPLSSCYSLAKKTGRQLVIIWVSNFRCRAEFQNLFVLNDSFILERCENISHYTNSVNVYGLFDSIYNESVLYNNNTMKNITDRFGLISVQNTKNILFSDVENIIVITNNFLDGASKEDEIYFLKEILRPNQQLISKINKEQEILNLDKTFFGIQARGTDFFVDDNYYYNCIYNEIPIGSKLFICSDSEDMEEYLKSKLSNVFDVYFRKNKIFVEKLNEDSSWFCNTETSVDCTKDGLVDMYLLAKTNFKIYNAQSTFGEIVKILSS